MPQQPTWLERIPDLLQTLKSETAPPYLNRTALETLFGVRRRRAIVLLHRCQAKRRGPELVAAREAVVAFLEQQLAQGGFEEAAEQKQRVAEFLGQARRALTLPTIAVPPPAKLSAITFAGLPPGIQLTPTQLSVTFCSAVDLVEKLFTLAQAFANDYESLADALAEASLEKKGAAPGISV